MAASPLEVDHWISRNGKRVGRIRIKPIVILWRGRYARKWVTCRRIFGQVFQILHGTG